MKTTQHNRKTNLKKEYNTFSGTRRKKVTEHDSKIYKGNFRGHFLPNLFTTSIHVIY